MKTSFIILAFVSCTYSIFAQNLSLFPVSAPLEQGTAHIEAVPMNLNSVSEQINDTYYLIDDRVEGSVKVNILINNRGEYIRHKQLTGHPQVLVSAIEEHIYKLNFIPAEKNGKRVASWLSMKFHFNLTN
ncbi:MAG: energy transducer TonB [Bacteroidota bacterium]